ncbi:hypothetical protein C8R45DRAFT_1087616 [Mycena sanguinolenta]|nr:hypothetical protein C8R45DRAFT_1087616 [Mycena sanguinolenta]
MPAIRTTQLPAGFILASTLLPHDAPGAPALFEKTTNTKTKNSPLSQGSTDEEEAACVAANARLLILRTGAKKLHYLGLAANYADIHDMFQPESGDLPREESKLIRQFIGAKQRDKYNLDDLRHRAICTCVYTDPGPLDAYFASAAQFWDEYGYLCDFPNGMDDVLDTKRTLRKIHKRFLRLSATVRLQLAQRTMRSLDIRNPFPLLNDRHVAFDLEVWERIATYKHISIEALAPSLDCDVITVRLHNRYRTKPSSIKCQELYCKHMFLVCFLVSVSLKSGPSEELWILDIESFVAAAKIEAREKTSLQPVSLGRFYGVHDTVFN